MSILSSIGRYYIPMLWSGSGNDWGDGLNKLTISQWQL